jgi:hypothetical protein
MSLAQVGSLIENCNRQAYKIHNKALLHKWVANICNFLIIIGSTLSGAISTYKGSDLPTVILSFGVAALKSLMVFYTPERRALILERISIEISRLARKLRRLDTVNPDPALIKKAIERTYDRLDDLKIRQFGEESSKILGESSPTKNSVPQPPNLNA